MLPLSTKILVGDHKTNNHVMKWRKPIIAIGWSCIQAGDMDGMMASLAGVERGTLTKNLQADRYSCNRTIF
jgi:hypothetical protein